MTQDKPNIALRIADKVILWCYGVFYALASLVISLLIFVLSLLFIGACFPVVTACKDKVEIVQRIRKICFFMIDLNPFKRSVIDTIIRKLNEPL